MKDKVQSIFLFLALLTISFGILSLAKNQSQAVEIVSGTSKASSLPEVEVKVNYTGLKAAETVGDIKENDSVLTRISDALLRGDSLYTSDSKTPNDLNGTDPGKTIVGDMGCILKSKTGEEIKELSITVQMFINTDKDSIAESIYQSWDVYQNMYTEEEFKALYTQGDDVLSSKYGTYLTEQYDLKIQFDSNGKFNIKIPENMPDDYIISITEIQDPVTGEMININEYFRLFLALGDASNSNPGNTSSTDNGDKNGAEDDGHRYYSVSSGRTTYEDLEPEISSKIYSNSYDAEIAIPTSENLNYQITADNALYHIETRKTQMKAGVKGITIVVEATYPQTHTSVRYNASGDKIVKKWTTIETVSRTVTKNYSYEIPTITVYDVPTSHIYPVQNGSLQAENSGYTLSSGVIGLTGSQTKSPQCLSVTVKKPNVNNTEYANLGHYSSYSEARNAVNNNDGGSVKNRIKAAVYQAVNYTGYVNYAYYGLNVTTSSNNGVKPIVAKTTGTTTNMIPSNYPNGLYGSSGSVLYAGARQFGTKPNNVTVHTPVVNNAKISWISAFVNQKISKDSSRQYLMLDESFTITIPDNGTHNSYLGYGTRKYNTSQGVTGLATTWGKIKDVKLPFDAYLHYTKNGSTYKYLIKANTWLSESGAASLVSLTKNTYTFTVPVWVTEKIYDIETRVIAENATNYSLAEENKNGSVTNYVATKRIPVEVIGKIYDLRVSASNDPGWQNQIYSAATKKEYITAEEFPFGQQGQNRVTQYKYAPKLGYTFVFDFKTKGRKSNNIDISIQPEGFYFVSKDGKTVKEVDLYYNTTTKKNIQITPSDNNVNLSVRLSDAYLKVAAQEFVDSTRIYKTEFNKIYNYNLGVNVGTFAKMNLPHSLRLCYNNFAEYVGKLYGKGATENSISTDAGTKDNVIGSVGHWYAGYRLPASTRAIPKGSSIDEAVKKNSFLTDGYILVKFDIKTKYQNGSGNYDYLQYMGPEAINEGGDNAGYLVTDWTKGGTQDITLPNGNKATVPVGTVAIYEAGLRSSNDAEVAGTH